MTHPESKRNIGPVDPGSLRDASIPELPREAMVAFVKPESYNHLPALTRKEIVYNLGFIDVRDFLKSLAYSRRHYPDAAHPALHIHKYYLEIENSPGRFPHTAFSNYRLARAYIERRAASGKTMEVGTLLKANALVLHGDMSLAPGMIRATPRVMMVRRHPGEIAPVFGMKNGRCAYKTGGPLPPVRGFFPGNFWEMHARPTASASPHHTAQHFLDIIRKEVRSRTQTADIEQIVKNYPFAAILNAMDISYGCSTRTQKALDREIDVRLAQSPADVKSNLCAVVFANNRLIIRKHLDDVINYYKLATERIVQNPVLSPGGERYLNTVCLLAARIARIVDMGHFGYDGMGRTSLLVERYILTQFGIRPPIWVADYDKTAGKHFENGTYRQEEHRAKRLVATVKKEGHYEAKSCLTAVAKIIKCLDGDHE